MSSMNSNYLIFLVCLVAIASALTTKQHYLSHPNAIQHITKRSFPVVLEIRKLSPMQFLKILMAVVQLTGK